MMDIKRFISVLLFVTALALTVQTAAWSSGLNWHPHQEGMELGKTSDKDIFINFYADWCHYCQRMDEITFRDPDVIAFLNKHFILVKIEAEEQVKIAKEYYVRGLPMGWFVSSSGEKIAPMPGFIPPDEFLSILKFIQAKAYETMTYAEFLERGN
jgi:thioredoxin 1